ncbi:unnamed protein product [Candidula unifasciata]|uniref:Hflx-type G domain-containing protein n=1 Tax=Candidula unifasciata TaxID=100452 RepID=A0A8S3YHX2_9EUPU|nr:unnamed protein product [Candidula unifasciata]
MPVFKRYVCYHFTNDSIYNLNTNSKIALTPFHNLYSFPFVALSSPPPPPHMLVTKQKNGNVDNSLNTEENDDEEYGEYLREICTIPGMGHRVLVIQPDIKTGSRRYLFTTRELKLEETCALVRTLPNWKVVKQKIVRTDFERTKNVFGSGNFELLLREVRSKKTITAVVIGIDRLTGLQINTLQEAWGLPVYDRYMLVLQIFKDHAQSPEAKLQVALAEIHYIRSRMQLILGGYDAEMMHLIGAGSQMHRDNRRMLLQRRESKLKCELEKLHSQRQTVRQTRVHNSVPTVAVVGYTNSGKTTLIVVSKFLFTGKTTLCCSICVPLLLCLCLPLLPVCFFPLVVCFCFFSLLDVILHIRDASHPDRKLQILSVHKTLESLLGEDKLQNMLEVYNKVDLITEEEAIELDPGILQISAVKGQGLADLGVKLEEMLLTTAGHMKKTFRIPNSEGMLNWLYQEAAVESAVPDPKDGQFLIVRVIISKPAYGKFQARFSRRSSSS